MATTTAIAGKGAGMPTPKLGRSAIFHTTDGKRFAAVIVDIHPAKPDGQVPVTLFVMTPTGTYYEREAMQGDVPGTWGKVW